MRTCGRCGKCKWILFPGELSASRCLPWATLRRRHPRRRGTPGGLWPLFRYINSQGRWFPLILAILAPMSNLLLLIPGVGNHLVLLRKVALCINVGLIFEVRFIRHQYPAALAFLGILIYKLRLHYV